jgi:hypothetical protein
MPNITNIPSQRVPFVDKDGLLTREWYRFFFNMFTLVGGGSSDLTAVELAMAPLPQQPVSDESAEPLIEPTQQSITLDQIRELILQNQEAAPSSQDSLNGSAQYLLNTGYKYKFVNTIVANVGGTPIDLGDNPSGTGATPLSNIWLELDVNSSTYWIPLWVK